MRSLSLYLSLVRRQGEAALLALLSLSRLTLFFFFDIPGIFLFFVFPAFF